MSIRINSERPETTTLRWSTYLFCTFTVHHGYDDRNTGYLGLVWVAQSVCSSAKVLLTNNFQRLYRDYTVHICLIPQVINGPASALWSRTFSLHSSSLRLAGLLFSFFSFLLKIFEIHSRIHSFTDFLKLSGKI